MDTILVLNPASGPIHIESSNIPCLHSSLYDIHLATSHLCQSVFQPYNHQYNFPSSHTSTCIFHTPNSNPRFESTQMYRFQSQGLLESDSLPLTHIHTHTSHNLLVLEDPLQVQNVRPLPFLGAELSNIAHNLFRPGWLVQAQELCDLTNYKMYISVEVLAHIGG
jgi:hypothetical protein